MTLTFEKPEPSIAVGPNWSMLEALIHRFSPPGLKGGIVLRRTLMLKNLQLCLSGECGGEPIQVLSPSFSETLITHAAQQERMACIVSQFLAKVTYLHEKQCAVPSEPVARFPDVCDPDEGQSDKTAPSDYLLASQSSTGGESSASLRSPLHAGDESVGRLLPFDQRSALPAKAG